MNIVDRVKNILITPKTEWEVIKAESTPQAQIITGYVLPLAGIAALCGLIGSALLGISFLGASFLLWALVGAVLQVVMAVVAVFVVSFVIDALAVNFNATKGMHNAFKVAAYSFTAAWVASFATIVPILGGIIALIGALYGFYLLYLGLRQVMGAPEEKAVVYTIVVVVVTIIVMIVANMVVAAAAGFGVAGAARGYRGSVDVPSARVASASSKLEAMAKQVEAAGAKMDAAAKSGDQQAQAAAALEVLGAAVTGGRKVESLSVEEVKAFVPEKFAGLPKTSSAAERSGISSLMVTTAKANYGDNSGKSVRLEVTDAGGAGAMVGLASWLGAMNTEREDDNGAERTKKDGNRIVHERVSKKGGDNEYSVVLAERYIVKTVGSGGVDLGTLKGGVSGMDLAKLESMKDVGVAKN